MSPPSPATMTSSGPVPASLWTQKKSINNDGRHSAFPFLVRRFKIIAQNASGPCSVSERPVHHCEHRLSHQIISKPVQSFLFSMDLAKAPPSLTKYLWRHLKSQECEDSAILSICHSTWEQVLVWLEIPGPRSTAMGSPQSVTQDTYMGCFLLGLFKSHKEGREYRNDHAADRVRAEEGLVWVTQRYSRAGSRALPQTGTS